MAQKGADYNDPNLFQFPKRTGNVKVQSMRKFGKKGEAVTALALSIEVQGVGALALALLLGSHEDDVRRALWDVGAIERGVTLDGVPPLMKAGVEITTDATFTGKHWIKVGGLKMERVHILQGFHVTPAEGCVADVRFSAVLHSPAPEFIAGLADLLRDPVDVQLTQDPELPLADVRHSKGDGEDGEDDGQGGLDV